MHTNDVWYANGDGSGDATSVASFAAQSDVNVRQKQRKLTPYSCSTPIACVVVQPYVLMGLIQPRQWVKTDTEEYLYCTGTDSLFSVFLLLPPGTSQMAPGHRPPTPSRLTSKRRISCLASGARVERERGINLIRILYHFVLYSKYIPCVIILYRNVSTGFLYQWVLIRYTSRWAGGDGTAVLDITYGCTYRWVVAHSHVSRCNAPRSYSHARRNRLIYTQQELDYYLTRSYPGATCLRTA